jgi:hypothetical protein
MGIAATQVIGAALMIAVPVLVVGFVVVRTMRG